MRSSIFGGEIPGQRHVKDVFQHGKKTYGVGMH